MDRQEMKKARARAFRERIDELKHRMKGRWMAMIAWSAPELYEAAKYLGRTTLCPAHEERAFFRFFPDSNDTGAGYCPICGHFGDGIAVLKWIHGISFYEVIDELDEWLADYEAAIRWGRPCRLTAEAYQLPKPLPVICLKRRTASPAGKMD